MDLLMPVFSFSLFRSTYDLPGNFILLEGKRAVNPSDKHKLYKFGVFLAMSTNYMTFRSGNASGSDQFFCEGVASVAPQRIQLITPFKGHRKNSVGYGDIVSLDQINLKNEPQLIELSLRNRRSAGLIKMYAEGEKGSLAMKGSYLIRDTLKVAGSYNVSPASFGIFYDDLAQPKSGGTGHTMMICEHLKVPYIDQSVWMEWLLN